MNNSEGKMTTTKQGFAISFIKLLVNTTHTCTQFWDCSRQTKQSCMEMFLNLPFLLIDRLGDVGSFKKRIYISWYILASIHIKHDNDSSKRKAICDFSLIIEFQVLFSNNSLLHSLRPISSKRSCITTVSSHSSDNTVSIKKDHYQCMHNMYETKKKETVFCSPGSCTFHNVSPVTLFAVYTDGCGLSLIWWWFVISLSSVPISFLLLVFSRLFFHPVPLQIRSSTCQFSQSSSVRMRSEFIRSNLFNVEISNPRSTYGGFTHRNQCIIVLAEILVKFLNFKEMGSFNIRKIYNRP